MKARYLLAAIPLGMGIAIALPPLPENNQIKNFIIGGASIMAAALIIKAYKHFQFYQKNAPRPYRFPRRDSRTPY